jgi:hypothetical protein
VKQWNIIGRLHTATYQDIFANTSLNINPSKQRSPLQHIFSNRNRLLGMTIITTDSYKYIVSRRKIEDKNPKLYSIFVLY